MYDTPHKNKDDNCYELLKYQNGDQCLSKWWNGQSDRLARMADITSGSSPWQGTSAKRLVGLSEHAQTIASYHLLPERKRSGERKWPIFHAWSSGTIHVQPDQHWYSFKGIFSNAVMPSLGQSGKWGLMDNCHGGMFQAGTAFWCQWEDVVWCCFPNRPWTNLAVRPQHALSHSSLYSSHQSFLEASHPWDTLAFWDVKQPTNNNN